jgi:hypothetical protein
MTPEDTAPTTTPASDQTPAHGLDGNKHHSPGNRKPRGVQRRSAGHRRSNPTGSGDDLRFDRRVPRPRRSAWRRARDGTRRTRCRLMAHRSRQRNAACPPHDRCAAILARRRHSDVSRVGQYRAGPLAAAPLDPRPPSMRPALLRPLNRYRRVASRRRAHEVVVHRCAGHAGPGLARSAVLSAPRGVRAVTRRLNDSVTKGEQRQSR